jgi:hypothetical protein
MVPKVSFSIIAVLLCALTSSISSAAMAQGSQPAPQVAPQPAQNWDTLPRMQLERQFAGPLRDTIIQRWRDPNDGTVCYIYLPITAAHSPPAPSGFVQYGANTIGSLSCLAGGPKPAQPAAAKPSPPK